MKKIITLLSVFFVFIGFKAYAVWDDDFGEMLEVTIPYVHSFTDTDYNAVPERKLDVLDTQGSWIITYRKLMPGVSSISADQMKTDINNALRDAGAWVEVSSFKKAASSEGIDASETFVLKVKSSDTFQPICFKTEAGNMLKLGRVPTSLELYADKTEAFPGDNIMFTCPNMSWGRTYTLYLEDENGEISGGFDSEQFTYNPSGSAPRNHVATIPLVSEGKYRLTMRTFLAYDGPVQSNTCEINYSWPLYSLFEVEPNDDTISNDGQSITVKRRYKLENGEPFTSQYQYAMESFINRFNNGNYNHEYCFWPEEVKISSDYDVTKKEYILEFSAIPNMYETRSFSLPLSVEGDITVFQDGYYEAASSSIHGEIRTDPYRRHAITVSGATKGFKYTLYNGDLEYAVATCTENGEVVFDNITENGTYKVYQGDIWYGELINGEYVVNDISTTAINPSYDRNFVITHNYVDPQSKVSDIQYMDGLGRSIQSIAIGASPKGNDVVDFVIYDEMGRSDAVTYMPFGGNKQGHLYRYNNPEYGGLEYLQRLYYMSETNYDWWDYDYLFSTKKYDTSPDGRIIQESFPGSNGYNYPVEYSYGLNKQNENIVKFIYNSTDNSVNIAGMYADDQLTVTRSQQKYRYGEEFKRPITSEYKNSEGNVVAKRVQYGDNDIRTTYYVYDELDRQRYIIPQIQLDQMSEQTLSLTRNDLKSYSYYIAYDDFGNIIEQDVPGMEYSQSIYDNRGRLVLTQSANMREKDEWLFTKYDEMDRLVMTGILTGGTYEQHLNAVKAQLIFGEERGTTMHGYTNRCYPTNINENDILIINYYDDYEWFSDPKYEFSEINSLDQQRSLDILSLRTGSKTRVLGINDVKWLTSVTYYDEKYNSIQTIQDLFPNGKEVVANKHNWVGKVTQTKVMQTTDAGTYEYNKWFDHDDRGRLLSIRQIITGDPRGEITLASYTYDDTGKMKAKSIHNGTDVTTYRHSVSGMQTESTSIDFSYKLELDNPIIDGQEVPFTGDIARVSWTHSNEVEKAYKFQYNRQGQMTAANLLIKAGGDFPDTDKFSEKGLSYDKNGNILSLVRTDNQGQNLHNINYNYDGNKLTSLNYNGSPTAPFRYDPNGNMTYDGLTGVEIDYNILNLPQRIFAGSDEIRYIYSASGEKLASEVDGSLTYYRSVMVYSTNGTATEQLSHILHPEGIVQYNENSTESKYTYKYFKTDHLGSTRAVVAAIAENGTYSMNVEQSTDYFPFGMVHELGDLAVNKYLFSGKEIQDANVGSLGLLGMYDFGSRYYNPMLGRWFNIDPALQMTNPYIYCGNSPMMYVDPDGELSFLAILGITAGIFATGNTVAHAIRGDINNIGDFFKYFGQGAIGGATVAAAWQYAPMIPVIGEGIQTAMTYYAYGQAALGAVGMVGGLISGGWSGLGRGAQVFLGNFYLDENNWGSGIWQGVSRHTWEMPQSFIGHGYTQFANAFGEVNRVDYLGGATFATQYFNTSQGVSMGNFVNIKYNGEDRWNGKTFDDFVISNPLYMHEYGHTIDSRRRGLSYLFYPGIPSLISAGTSKNVWGEPNGVTTHKLRRYEISANRRASKYFGQHYGVDWNSPYMGHTIETYYPTIKR